MAIEKTVFTGTTPAANAPEVYEFLNANKAGYFDSVVMDETTNNVTCYVGETPALKLGFNDSSKVITITLANGVSVSDLREASNSTVWLYGIKTSKGLALHCSGSSRETRDILVSKTDSGSLAIVSILCTSASSTQLRAADIVHGSEFIKAFGAFGSSAPFYTMGVTTLTQIPLSQTAESYAPDVYLTFFGQYLDTRGKLAANGKEYYYTGYIALGD